MTDPIDKRWIEAQDAAALDEAAPLESNDVAPSTDARAQWQAEAEFYTALGEAGEPIVEPGDEATALDLVEQFHRQPVSASAPTPIRFPAKRAVLAVTAIAAGLLLWLRVPTPPDAAAFRVTSGRFESQAAAYTAGSALPRGLLTRAQGADACATNSALTVCGSGEFRFAADPGTAALEVLSGAATVQAQVQAQGDGAKTTAVRAEFVTLEATTASYELRYGGTSAAPHVRVHVTAGTIRALTSSGAVPLRAGEERTFRAGAAVDAPVVATTETQPAPQHEDDGDAGEPREGPDRSSGTNADPDVAAPTTGTSSTPTPARKPKRRAKHDSAPVPAKTAPTAAEMLARARRLKGTGDRKAAADAYEALRRVHPKSAEAHAAAVALGQLQLRLGRARAALRVFDAYLQRGGALAEEAAWGKIRALDRLGNARDRDAAIATFVAEFPQSPYRRRAAALASDATSTTGAPP